ncbi:hypothetical protein P8625_06260 [Tenacibaculum tangerinum]|uniref:Uncharacterized protein n=1 Tax=Tenacibaculum tangerinum TaxID=3038772 RepID=A0ABY8L931_9FLAO|nr:hypothetical protein [Tenacibaculum tangerinum]WGH76755.1 hypothetical protein P8625_06260 [Tenacibaculum tangerinum]
MENNVLKKESTVTSITTPNEVYPRVSKELITEINNMLSYAIYNGIVINTEVNSLIESKDLSDLINAHNILVKNIAPATPKSIEYTKKLRTSGEKKSIFGKLPIVRNLVFLALFFLILFVVTALSPNVNNDSLDKGLMNNSGMSLLLNLSFLASVSGLGVVFYLLKKVSDSIKESTMVSEESISYFAQVVLGIIAGLIMSEIISFYSSKPEGINLFNKGILALIGGFSSEAIFSILQGIIDRIKSIFIVSKSN